MEMVGDAPEEQKPLAGGRNSERQPDRPTPRSLRHNGTLAPLNIPPACEVAEWPRIDTRFNCLSIECSGTPLPPLRFPDSFGIVKRQL